MNDNVSKYAPICDQSCFKSEDVKSLAACCEDTKHETSYKNLIKQEKMEIYDEDTSKTKFANFVQQFSNILKEEELMKKYRHLYKKGYYIAVISNTRYSNQSQLKKRRHLVKSQKVMSMGSKICIPAKCVSEISCSGRSYRCYYAHNEFDLYEAEKKRKAEEREQAIERQKDLFDKYGVFGQNTYD